MNDEQAHAAARQKRPLQAPEEVNKNPPSAGFFMAISKVNSNGGVMGYWAKVGLTFVGIIVAATVIESRAKPEISWKCTAKGDAGSCVVENKGGKEGTADFDVVQVCRDGEHVAHVSAHVDAHNHTTKIIDSFSPAVGLLANCVGLDHRNVSVK